MGVQFYVAQRMPAYIPPGEVEDDEMLDFGDIGGVYDDATAAAANTSALQSFLSSRASSQGVQLMFSGNRLASYNDRRQPGTAYLDVTGGPITYAPSGTSTGSLALVGMAGAEIRGNGIPPAATSPIFEITRPVGGLQSFTFTNLRFLNGLGSGIKFNAPGSRTLFSDCTFHNIGTSIVSPPAVDFDGWTDLDTAVYALWFDEADGGHLHNCAIVSVHGHGMIVKRWHEADAHLSTRQCLGSGLKAQQVHGTTLNLRSESNEGWGLHVRDCGNQTRTSGGTRGEDGGPNAWDIWCEANNDRGADGSQTSGSGYRYRQIKIDGSSRLTIGGHFGWSEGKVSVQEPSRRCVRLVEQDFIDPSPGDGYATLIYDMNNDGAQLADGTQDNWATIWPSPGDRPTTTPVGDTSSGTYQIQLTIPTGAYYDADQEAAGDAWWRPIPSGVTVPGATSGDTWMWTAEISTDGNGVDYCTSREALAAPTPRMPAYLGKFGLSTGDAGKNFALWSQASQKFSGRVHMETSGTPTMQMSPYFSGMGDTGGSGLQYPTSQIVLTIRSLKLYRINA